MRKLWKSHSHAVISSLAILALIGIIIESKGSRGLPNFFYCSTSRWLWPKGRSTIGHGVAARGGAGDPTIDPLVHSLAVIHNSSTLAKKEEKRQRTMMKLRDEIDKVLKGRQKDEKVKNIEEKLARARALIKAAMRRSGNSDHNSSISLEDIDYVPQGNIYKNALAFHRSYLLMEKMFKIFIYEEGEPPLFHDGPYNNIYSIEGVFINSIQAHSHFRTKDPSQAHVFFLPFSVVMIIQTLFDPIVRDKAVLERTIVDYIRVISNKYPYWNRSLAADHFMLSCHDWGPRATWYHPLLYFHSIRALCNANISENFNPRKDVSIPEINLKTGEILTLSPGLPPSERTNLAFFTGRMHGLIRTILLKHWRGQDEDILVYDELPKNISYDVMMKTSKYCLCPSGFEVASPRIAEAIYAECVPVLISQSYVLPFSDVLNWDSFSVQVSVGDIPNLKRILVGIPYEKYLKMHDGVKQVQRHFLVNYPPKRYDVFHMTVHSIWLRRLNIGIRS